MSARWSLRQTSSVRDTVSGTTRRVSVSSAERQSNRSSYFPVVSGNGRFVVFYSEATNLVRRDRNGSGDVFMRDLRRGTTRLVSVSSRERQADGRSGNATISDEGRYVAFNSAGSRLAPRTPRNVPSIFVRDVRRGTTTRVDTRVAPIVDLWHSVISGNGRFIATRINGHIFVYDRAERQTRHATINAAGEPANGISLMPSLSRSGRYLTFTSNAQNLVPTPDPNGGAADVYVRDMTRHTLRRIPGAPGSADSMTYQSDPVLSGDGRYVVYTTNTLTATPFGNTLLIAGPLR